MRSKFYSLKNILTKNAQYNVIFGERSNGKTYAVLKYAIENYIKTGKQMAIVRRWREDFTGKRGASMFDALTSNNEISKMSDSEWTGVYYFSSRWYLCRKDGDNRVTDEKPFAYGFAISGGEHDKSTSYPDITTILFDEFLSRQGYIQDEFILFMNTVSTIIRNRKDVTIFMLGNTVNRYCPYFNEMGLKHVKDMKPGTIDVYRYGDSELTVAVEYTQPNKNGKESDLYFAFDNPKLSMITGGAWEIAIYPHLPERYTPNEVIFKYYIIFDGDTLECEVIRKKEYMFTFIHRKTTAINNPEDKVIFSPDFSPYPNHHRKLNKSTDRISSKLAWFFANDKVYYSENEVGEIVMNYLKWCGK